MKKSLALRCKPKHHDELAKAVGEWIKSTRVRRQLTQKALASRAGCSQNQVFLVESGATSVTLAVLIDLTIELGLRISDAPIMHAYTRAAEKSVRESRRTRKASS